jgi:hypothetical protein
MLEPVEQAGRGPAPGQIIQVGFVELAGIGHDRVVAAYLPIPVGHAAVVGENVARLVVQRSVVEQVVVLAQAEKVEPRSEPGLVIRQAAIDLGQTEAEHAAGEVAQRAVAAHQLDAQQLALQGFQFDAGIVRQQFDAVRERARQAFGGFQRVDQQGCTGTIAVGKR